MFHPWVGKIPWKRKWQPTAVFLLGKFHGQRSLTGYSPLGHKESDMIEKLNTHTHIYMIGKHTFMPLLCQIRETRSNVTSEAMSSPAT